jgi:predicted nuclease of predicted toxin-antitoxin system
MAVGLLLDEMVEHEVYHRLQSDGHEVEHVHFHDSLGGGDDDARLAEYSLYTAELIVTYDDDFEAHYQESDYWGVLLFSDDAWSADEVADTVHEILTLYDENTLQQMNLVGREWL